ncbi:Dihydroorotate oxidase electron-transfer subunit [uncultured Desulfobacterium sp.]|uniref:Dihydroorotate oxidase electron-transfer subunit n=1 Tax=uncultured Desulfobacterium sp. TaxID=201089 RepID=A0A445N088_9BACT|nr:Dihydroorotate oxidase electron-transfer subunit [uncultured Desulfobacterium sp.]
MKDLPRTVKIIKRTVHNNDNVTLHLDAHISYSPGQFLMIWLPGLNEKPFSIAGHDSDGVMVTVRRRGAFSGRLVELKEGSLIGIRGPYGRPFKLVGNCCIIAGGIGLACLAPVADLYKDAPILYGEDRASSRIYQERFPSASFYTTDGSAGKKGFPTDDLESVIRERGCDMVYCCGPEPMLVKTVRICNALGVGCQASMERYMKCGTGVCGQCACGQVRVCVEGTVFQGNELLQNPDFGRRRLDASGTWRPV